MFVSEYIKFSFQNLGNSREDKNRRRETTFGFEIEKKFNISKILAKLNFNTSDSKICLLIQQNVLVISTYNRK